MTRIPLSAKPRDLSRTLQAIGFICVRTRGDHIIYRHPATHVRVAFSNTLRPGSAAIWRNQVVRVRRAITEHERREGGIPCGANS